MLGLHREQIDRETILLVSLLLVVLFLSFVRLEGDSGLQRKSESTSKATSKIEETLFLDMFCTVSIVVKALFNGFQVCTACGVRFVTCPTP